MSTDLGESPLWDAEKGLRWLDIAKRQLLTIDRDGVEHTTSLPTKITAIELGTDSEILAITSDGFSWLDAFTGRLDPIVTVLHDETITMNDGGIDARGRAWAGSATHDRTRRGRLYRLEGEEVTDHVIGLGMSNGIDWSPDGRVLYHVDSVTGTITAWEYDLEAGKVATPRTLHLVSPKDGLPDGLTVDSNGDIWTAIWGRGEVWRLKHDTGEKTAVVTVPTPYPTSCVFGGPDLSTLYITTAKHDATRGGGLLYAVATPTRGRHPYRFLSSK